MPPNGPSSYRAQGGPQQAEGRAVAPAAQHHQGLTPKLREDLILLGWGCWQGPEEIMLSHQGPWFLGLPQQ